MASNASSSIQNARILIIDDDSEIRALIRMSLEKHGYRHIEDAGSARIGLKKIEERKADLVLLDWFMPEISGLDILSSVRSWNKELPIVMLTAQGAQDRVIAALKAGASDYIVKPFSRSVLLTKIDELLTKLSS